MSTAALRKQLAEIRERADYLADVIPNADRNLPAYAWPGGYPVFYLTASGLVLCADCATTALDESDTFPDDLPTDQDANWEGPSLYCEGCDCEIESAYGDPDAPERTDAE